MYYMNFKYGFSQYPGEPSLPREVRERDYFFVGSFAVFGAFVALGLGALMQRIVELLRDRGDRGQPLGRRQPGARARPSSRCSGNRITASRAHETTPRDFAYDILQSVEPYGILITAGDNDTFPLWYAQEVEGIRRDVTLANLSLMNTRWHLRQLRRRQTPRVRSGRGGGALEAAAGGVRCSAHRFDPECRSTGLASAHRAGLQSDRGSARQPARGHAGAGQWRRGIRQPQDRLRRRTS